MQMYAIYFENRRVGSKYFDGYSKRDIEKILRREFGLKGKRNVEVYRVNF